jgi:pyruvate-ferredoxin/flavodoxin oxidoreductase
LYLDVITALSEAQTAGTLPFAAMPRVIGGRYGLSSKEFTPAMVKAVFDEAAKPAPKNHFTVGIDDDVTFTSLKCDPTFSTEDPKGVRALFFGLGADGTVGANKNSVKIIGEETDNYAQGYFVYDSKKSGSITISHLRFGPRPIRSTYLISHASFVACHLYSFLERIDMLRYAEPGATVLLNAPFAPEAVWDQLPRPVQAALIEKHLKLYVIDAYEVAKETGMGSRINTVMQTCFFAISGVLPREEAIEQIKKSIVKTYGKRGESVVQKNFAAVDRTIDRLIRGEDSGHCDQHDRTAAAGTGAGAGVRAERPGTDHLRRRRHAAGLRDASGRHVPDGHRGVGEAQHRTRDPGVGREAVHPVRQVRAGVPARHHPGQDLRPAEPLAGQPETFKAVEARWKDYKHLAYSLQVAPEDCTGCGLCVQACPVKDKSDTKRRAINMQEQLRCAPPRPPTGISSSRCRNSTAISFRRTR